MKTTKELFAFLEKNNIREIALLDLVSKMKLTGYVLWFNVRDGYGIIKDDQGIEYYTDISVTPNREPLKRDTKVNFELNPKIKDCRCAWKVEVLK